MSIWGDIAARVRGDEGATAVEYAILAALIAAVIVGVVTAVGLATNDLFVRVTTSGF